ncbi:hypothetical protein pEaSNUABM54_00285 [Erwinia phage pEa_SNUABM_54]|nr:hypothetical protein pEaSNUABM54_00285 [Erwinia phage pEa_SNUABM_54]
MDNIQYALERETGELPVSIGTALAFEPVFIAKTLAHYDIVLINIRTIIRNYYASVASARVDSVNHSAAAYVIAEELRTLSEHFTNVTPIIYYSEYEDLGKYLPGCLVKTDFTEKALVARDREAHTLNCLVTEQQVAIRGFKECALTFKEKGRALLFSHIAVDLLLRYNFTKFELLESYTAAIKQREQWNSKLTNGKALTRMPFNRFTLTLYGDNGLLLRPQLIQLRRALMLLSEEQGWTTVTTMDKIKADIQKIPNVEYRTLLAGLARPYL